MYKLESGDRSNVNHLLFLESDPEIRALIKKRHTAHNVSDMIFNEKIDEDTCDDVISALSIGDELKVPITENQARYLFFALCVNITHQKVRIKTISKAGMMYKEYNGDYSKAIFVDQENSIAYLAKIKYDDIVQNNSGNVIQYQIPLYTCISPDKSYFFTIADQNYYYMRVNDRKEIISRKALLSLVNLAFAKKFNNHEDVLEMIDKSTEVLIECLNSASFNKLEVDFPFDNAMVLEFTENLDILAYDEPEEESEDWERKDRGKYRLNKVYENIVPFKPTGPKMTAYIL